MNFLYRWLPVGILLSFINYLSSRPSLHVVPSSWLPLWLEQKLAAYAIKIGTTGFWSYTLTLQPEFVVRKFGHFLVFGLLGEAFFFALKSKRLGFLLAVLMAVLDEVHQGFVPGRDCRFWDIIVDSAGAYFGASIMVELIDNGVKRVRHLQKKYE